MRCLRFLISFVAATCCHLAMAQEYPSRPVKMIVTFPVGGASDIVARIFAERLSEVWRQQVFIENRIGGGGSIGTEAAYRAEPDGYTLLLASSTPIINQVLIPGLAFTYTKDFPTIAVVSSAPMMIAVHPSVPVMDLKELTAMLKAAPGKHDYTACNMASPYHFAMEMYKQAVGVFAVHIPHRGCSPATADAVAGHIKIVVTNLPTALPFMKQGRLRPIALMSKDRSSSVPDVPTARESGIPQLKDYYLESYYGFMAPPKTPAAIVAKVEADILNLAARPDVRKRLEGAGLDMLVLNSKQMADLIRADAEKYARVAKQAGIKVE
jgi:tripartite-type tricarboxylate transporter receptor subunit TctC